MTILPQLKGQVSAQRFLFSIKAFMKPKQWENFRLNVTKQKGLSLTNFLTWQGMRTVQLPLENEQNILWRNGFK